MKKIRNKAIAALVLTSLSVAGDAQKPQPEYFKMYEHLAMTRTADGILEVRFHTGDEPITFTGKDHHDFVEAFFKISQDRDNKVVILTGTGDEWMAKIDGASLGDITNPRVWDATWWEGQKLLQNLLDIGVPVIAAINGPVLLHSEYALTADIIIASENAYFQDVPHLNFGILPGDGVQIMWNNAIGEYRTKYFLYTQQKITAKEAKDLGVVSEVVSTKEAVKTRAYEIAEKLLTIPELTRRYMRATLAANLKKSITSQLGLGLALEGLSAADLKNAAPKK